MSDPLFTFICEFDGGTYVSQVHAADEQKAITVWEGLLRHTRPMGERTDLIADAASEEIDPPILLNGLKGVWCWSTSADDKLVLTNIVQSSA